MSEETAKRVWREVLNAGIRVETLWQIVTGEWSRTQEAQNSLFWVSRVRGRGHARGWRVHARVGSLDLRTFDEAIQEDQQYRRRGERRLLFAEDWKPQLRKVRQKICAERPYNVANLADDSERVLTILEQARVKLNVEVFRHDYEDIRQYVDAHPPSSYTSSQWRGYRKLRAFVSSYRRVAGTRAA